MHPYEEHQTPTSRAAQERASGNFLAASYERDAIQYLDDAMVLEGDIEDLDKRVADEVTRRYAKGLATFPTESGRTNLFLRLCGELAEEMGVARVMASKARKRDKYLAMATAHAAVATAVRRA